VLNYSSEDDKNIVVAFLRAC